jgi:hypothetical protein
MNKIKLIALFLFCCAGAIAEELKVTTLETKSVNYNNGAWSATTFRITCINGYKWLQSGSVNTTTLSQMFTEVNNQPRLIKCEN